MIRGSEEAGFEFLQKEYEHPIVKRDGATLDPNKVYLGTISSFHQIFTALNIDEIRTEKITLHGNCNYRTTSSNEKRNLFAFI